MKSRYTFNATEGSVLETPNQYILVARPGFLRIVQPSAGGYEVTLVLLVASAFGVIGAFSLMANLPLFSAVSWENKPLLGLFLFAFFAAFFGMLYAAGTWSRTIAVAIASRRPGNAWDVTLRDFKPGKLVQQLLLQTPDNRFLSVQVEATTARLNNALRLCGIVVPTAPPTEAEVAAATVAQRPVVGPSLAPTGPGRINVAVFVIAGFIGLLNVLYVWFLVAGTGVALGILGLVIFVPLAAYLLRIGLTSRRFTCNSCRTETVFLRKGTTWTCSRCHGSWPVDATRSQLPPTER